MAGRHLLSPILAYTALLLVREERIAPYVITLAVTLFVNYYVAFFAALFIALYFLVLLVENVPFKRWKDHSWPSWCSSQEHRP